MPPELPVSPGSLCCRSTDTAPACSLPAASHRGLGAHRAASCCVTAGDGQDSPEPSPPSPRAQLSP